MPDNQYMEIKLPFDPAYPTEDVQFDQTVIGNETINGYDCQVIQYTYQEKKYGVMVQWVSEKLGFAVRIQTKNSKGKVTSTIDYTNIKPGKQPSSLFEIPEGYQKFNPFGGLKLPGQ